MAGTGKRVAYYAAVWGIAGCFALFGRAIWTLTPVAVEPLRQGMTAVQWGLWGAWVVFMIYSEGYRGIHQKFAPRLVVRAVALAHNPRPLHVILAPAFCMGLFHATRKRLIVSWCVLLGIVSLVVAVRHLEQPWRGIVDGGVVIGLALGALSILYHAYRGLRGEELGIAADLPGDGREDDARHGI